MKQLLVISLNLLFFASGYGQEIKVISKEDGQSLPSAQIFIQDKTLRKEKYFLTDNSGLIKINDFEKSEKLFLTISFFGYEKLTDSITTHENKTYSLTPEKTILNEIIVTAQYVPGSPEKAVHKIKVIDNRKIEAMGAVNLKDVLSNELNIRLSQDNVLGSSMSLQGMSGQNVKILIDGIPVTGRLNGNIDISQINMNNVERIEIIEGPLSVNYGTDALGGTINIITKKSQKEMFTVTSGNYYESNGQYNFNGKIGYRKKNNLISISGGRNYFDGWRTCDEAFLIETNRIADSIRYKNWKPKEQYFATVYYAHYFKKLKVGYTGDYFSEQIINKGLPRLPYFETAFDDYYNTKRINNSINLSGQINSNFYLNFLAAFNYFQRIKNTYYNDLTTLNKTLTENPGDQDTSTFNDIITRGTISRTMDTKLSYEIGYDIIHETSHGVRIKNYRQEIGDFAIFTSAEYKPIASITVRPGLRAIYNTAYKAPLVPSINVKYSTSFTKNKDAFDVRFSYARGFRSPSLKELYFSFVDINHNITGNKNLRAEQSNNFNINCSYTKSKNNISCKTDLSIFHNSIRDMISLSQLSSAQYSYFNIDKFKTLGSQLQNELSIKYFKISLGIAYIGRYNQLSEKYSTERFSYSPEGRCNILYEWQKQKMTLNIFYKYTGQMPAYAVNSSNEIYTTSLRDYHTADASVTKAVFRKKLNFTIGSKNIFNVKNIGGVSAGSAHAPGANTTAIGMGRTYFFKLDINLTAGKQ